MKITLTINGQQIVAEADEKEIEEAIQKADSKQTGYERNDNGFVFSQAESGGVTSHWLTETRKLSNTLYEAGNYYTDEKVSENNARADALMRKLRRFAAEHGGCRKTDMRGWMIGAHSLSGSIFPQACDETVSAGVVIFSSKDAAVRAISRYFDELNWYFTEYDPMPEGWWNDGQTE